MSYFYGVWRYTFSLLALLTALTASCGRPGDPLGMPPGQEPVSTTKEAEALGQPCGVVNGAQKFCKNSRISVYVAGIETFKLFHNVGRSTYDMASSLPSIWGIYKNSPEAWYAADPGGCAVFGPYLDLPGPGQVSADFHLYAVTGNTDLPAGSAESRRSGALLSGAPAEVRPGLCEDRRTDCRRL